MVPSNPNTLTIVKILIYISSMAAYHEIEKRENQRLFSSVPNQTTDVMDIDIESTKLVKSTN